ncbi:hypothetical protein Hypma_002760 [Hypsizygus marmoreus]|uniref:Uncharacterized protein n=1 Tax=Hypsizygus marmoreus TaxID=39966 RepID=A0A369J5W8_HYPMA|nr:hypothetical protein Hypma_002760 [Hypsizygus marmoreus]
MQIPTIALPLISNFSALTQSGILAILLIISYLHKGARYLVSGLIFAYVGFKTIVPISRWCFAVFKWIAMMGFYITYFQAGVGFIVLGIMGVVGFLEGLVKEHERGKRERGET